jgi:hypothetical protein
MKVRLIGRPGEVQQRGTTVVTALATRRAPLLPDGLPDAPAEPTVYTVYIAAKQWARVAPALEADPNLGVVIEGYCFHDAELKGLAVLAQSVMLKAPTMR